MYEILFQYVRTQELNDFAANWITKWLEQLEPTPIEITEDRGINLIKLGIGCDIAEQEKERLLNCFIETNSYNAALNYEKSLLIGRKGSGKSAIYIKLLEDISSDNLNYVVNLKPESNELLEDVKLSVLQKALRRTYSMLRSTWPFSFPRRTLQKRK